MRAYKEDNERLVAENTALKLQNRDVASYMEENERLLALIGLKESITDYTTVAARVISYSGNNWYEQIEINKGAINGLNPGNAVITPEGIVGKIVETGPNYSIVTTILDPDSDIGIRVARTGGSGIVEGDGELVKDGNCKLSFLDRDTPLIVGDIVRTSGTGGVYPPGLAVGSVMNVSADSMGNLKSALISPSVDFDKLNEVLVINGIKTQ
jgi:rod shape-determining protein MreC